MSILTGHVEKSDRFGFPQNKLVDCIPNQVITSKLKFKMQNALLHFQFQIAAPLYIIIGYGYIIFKFLRRPEKDLWDVCGGRDNQHLKVYAVICSLRKDKGWPSFQSWKDGFDHSGNHKTSKVKTEGQNMVRTAPTTIISRASSQDRLQEDMNRVRDYVKDDLFGRVVFVCDGEDAFAEGKPLHKDFMKNCESRITKDAPQNSTETDIKTYMNILWNFLGKEKSYPRWFAMKRSNAYQAMMDKFMSKCGGVMVEYLSRQCLLRLSNFIV